jgi:hypothetical protein
MAVRWREDEDSHATLLALLYCLYGQMEILVCLEQNYWSLLRRLGMCYEVLYTSYKMILHCLFRWMDCALNVLDVPCVQ